MVECHPFALMPHRWIGFILLYHFKVYGRKQKKKTIFHCTHFRFVFSRLYARLKKENECFFLCSCECNEYITSWWDNFLFHNFLSIFFFCYFIVWILFNMNRSFEFKASHAFQWRLFMNSKAIHFIIIYNGNFYDDFFSLFLCRFLFTSFEFIMCVKRFSQMNLISLWAFLWRFCVTWSST